MPFVDAELAEAKQIMIDFTTKFTKNYALLYTVALAKIKQREAMKAAKGSKWKLMKCTYEGEAPDRASGHMLKRSDVMKKWKDRYFVMRGNYVVEYWETEEQFKKGDKPRGSRNLSGFNRPITDPNNTFIRRLEELAKKVNLDIESLPKPDKYPDNTFICDKDGKTPLVLQTIEDGGKSAEENFKFWTEKFYQAWWYARPLDIDDDEAHKRCFWNALWRTRWESGCWGGFYGGGGEVSIITECINSHIIWSVMSKVDSKLSMPWIIRSKIRNGFQSSTYSMVSGAVGPMWKGLYEGVQKARPTLEEQLPKVMGPIGEAMGDLKKKISEEVTSASKETMDDKVVPHLSEPLNNLMEPITTAFKIIMEAFDEALEKAKPNYKTDEKRLYLVKHHSWTWKIWDAQRSVDGIYDLLWVLDKVFSGISPWGIIGRCNRRLRKHLRNALYTFETKLEDAGGVEHWDEVHKEVKALLHEDCRTGVVSLMARIPYEAVKPMWTELVVTNCRKLVAPLANAVPEAVKTFIDINEMLEDVLYEILMATCRAVAEPIAAKVDI